MFRVMMVKYSASSFMLGAQKILRVRSTNCRGTALNVTQQRKRCTLFFLRFFPRILYNLYNSHPNIADVQMQGKRRRLEINHPTGPGLATAAYCYRNAYKACVCIGKQECHSYDFGLTRTVIYFQTTFYGQNVVNPYRRTRETQRVRHPDSPSTFYICFRRTKAREKELAGYNKRA